MLTVTSLKGFIFTMLTRTLSTTVLRTFSVSARKTILEFIPGLPHHSGKPMSGNATSTQFALSLRSGMLQPKVLSGTGRTVKNTGKAQSLLLLSVLYAVRSLKDLCKQNIALVNALESLLIVKTGTSKLLPVRS